MTTYDSGPVGSAGWTRNLVVSTPAPDEVYLTTTGAGSGGAHPSVIASSAMPTPYGTLALNVLINGQADDLQFGVVDSSIAKTSNASQGAENLPSFWGAALDRYNNRVVFYAAGASVGTVAVDTTSLTSYTPFALAMQQDGASGVKFTLYRSGSSVATYTHATARPAYTSASMALGGRTGSLVMLGQVKGTPTFTDFDLTGTQVTGLTALTFSGGASVAFTTVAGSTGAEYRIDGGTPVSVGSATRTTITGLNNGQTYNIEVRATGAGTNSNWRSISVTPAPALLFDNFDRADVAPSTTALGTSTDGKTWTQSLNIGITSGLAYATTSAENLAWVAGTFDVDVTLVAPVAQSIGGSMETSLAFRLRDASNYWWLYYTSSGIYLNRRLNGATYQTFAFTTQAWATGRGSCTMRVLAQGSSIMLYIDGVLRASMEDTLSIPATDTSVGIRIGSTAGRVDMISANTPPAATPTPSHVYKGRDTKVLDTVGAA